MNELEIFNFNNNEVRTTVINNEPWFVLKDVCDVLGIKNATDVAKRLDDDEVTRFNLGSRSGESNIVNESGLYKVIFQSKKEEARKFTKWVTSEVLPQIRKTGSYTIPTNFKEALKLLVVQIEENEKLALDNKMKNQLIGELKPIADYVDIILKSKSLVTITQIAKDYGVSGTELNKKLHELGVQYKQGKQWLLYQKYHDRGYTHSETINIERTGGTQGVEMFTKWTQKGRMFLYNLLKEHGITPMIERKDES